MIVNKIDLVKEAQVEAFIRSFTAHMSFTEILPISAADGTNISGLLDKTWTYLPAGPLYYPDEDFTDQPVSFIIAELIREKALILTRDEIPHSLAVEIEEFNNENEGKIYLRAVIYTERDSQKGIVIGKNGQMLKKIGEQSRIDIENMLGRPTYLDLWVKVKKNWRDSENNLNQLGYRF